jgi:hypothetical protein
MRWILMISFLGAGILLGCHTSSTPPPQPNPKPLHEVRDQNGNVIEREVVSENEPPPPDIVEVIPAKPYPTALYIRGYWYHDRPRHRWIWIPGYWR